MAGRKRVETEQIAKDTYRFFVTAGEELITRSVKVYPTAAAARKAGAEWNRPVKMMFGPGEWPEPMNMGADCIDCGEPPAHAESILCEPCWQFQRKNVTR